MGMADVMSPYGSTRERPLATRAEPDMPAVDTLRGQGDEFAFSRLATADGNRQLNAYSKADLMGQIGALRKNAQAAGGLKNVEDSKAAQERWANFKAAYRSAEAKPFQVIGEVMSDEI